MNVSVYKFRSLCQNNQYLDIELQTDQYNYKRTALGSGLQFKSVLKNEKTQLFCLIKCIIYAWNLSLIACEYFY